MTQQDILQLGENMVKEHGRAYGSKDIAKALADSLKAKQLEKGILPRDTEVSPTTVSNYTVQLANHPDMTLTQNTVIKSTTRATAEKSLRSVSSLLAVVSSAHLIPVDEECPEIKSQLKSLDAKVRLLYDMVVDALGGVAVYPVKPEYTFSTDDTTCYIFEGKESGKDKWTLVSTDSIKRSGTNAVYRVEDNKMMNGMRVKLTFTFSAAGMCAPLFVTVSGLSEEEMPNKPFLHMKVPGLCIGGGGTTVNNPGMGHVFFMRRKEGADKVRYKHYQEQILLPFINGVRKELDDFDVSIGTSIPKKLTAVSWCDGDLAQVATIVNDIDRLTENLVIALKQNAARSAAEQAADLAKVFKTLKSLIGKMTGDDSPATQIMKKRIRDAMKELEAAGNLRMKKANHKNALVDFLSILPAAATQAATVKNIVHGFIENGMIDRESRRFPVLHKILHTLKRDILMTEVDDVLDAFPRLLDEVNQYGRVSEEVFDELGFT